MKIKSLGAGNEVGRSGFVIEEKQRILLDYGIKAFTRERRSEYPLDPGHIDTAIISHSHLDHVGYVPALFKKRKVEWYSTPPTYEVGEVLWHDSIKLAKIRNEELPFTGFEIKKAYKSWNPIIYNVEQEVGNFHIKMYDAGHIIGSAMVEIMLKERKILYTGDYKLEDTEMHKGAKIRGTDVLITEATYWNRNHPPRKELEKKLIEEIKETYEEGGTTLLPAFALGRTQELIKVVRKYIKDIPVYIDGMGKKITRIYLKYPGFFREFDKFRKAVRNVNMVETIKQREKALKEPSIIISTAGMLEGGPALYYISRLNPQSKIILTGYCVEGTNGRKLLEESIIDLDGYKLHIDLPVKYLDFSAHAGRDEVLEFIKESNAEEIIIVHSDGAVEFAEELKENGFNAKGIKVGEEIEL